MKIPRPGRLWWLLCRDFARGWETAWADYITANDIFKWVNPRRDEAPCPVSVHVLTGAADFRLALWMFASLIHFTKRNWRIAIHDDGSLPANAAKLLEDMELKTCVISRKESDVRMEAALANRPFCAAYRKRMPHGIKSFDASFFAKGERFILVDSDLLFFREPKEILDWVEGVLPGSWFLSDIEETSLLSVPDAADFLGIQPWARVNTGLCLLEQGVADIDFMERALRETRILEGHPWRVEQTLLALCGSSHGKGGLLPDTYEVSLNRERRADCVCRHYVGAVRDRFYGEGIVRLKGKILQESPTYRRLRS